MNRIWKKAEFIDLELGNRVRVQVPVLDIYFSM